MILPSVLSGGPALGQEPCSDPHDPCVEELLAAFQPYLLFEDSGPGGSRREFPVLFTGADDDTVENNLETLSGGPAYCVYPHAVRLETPGAPGWLLQYHYYYGANWQTRTWPADCYTHEHDWEWVYVYACWSWRLQRYIGYAATYSSHDRDNLEAMFFHHTCLFPLIALEEEDPQGWVRSDRRLSRWTADEDDLLTHAAFVATAKGNAFSPDLEAYDALLVGGLPAISAEPPALWQLGYAGSACRRATTEANCYGDPRGCALPFVCSGLAECEDCGPERHVPWRRAGLWGADCVPASFTLPGDPRTEVDPQPASGLALAWEVGDESWEVRWCWDAAQVPDSFELAVMIPTVARRCLLGRVPAAGGCCRVIAVPARGGSRSGAREALRDAQGWRMASDCLDAAGAGDAWIELWAHWPGRPPALAARSSMRRLPEGPGAARVSIHPNPVRVDCAVEFFLHRPQSGALAIADLSGRVWDEIAFVCAGVGWQSIRWRGTDRWGRPLPTGVYWARLEIGRERRGAQFLLLR